MKRRILRILAIVLVVGLFTGYFVFTTLFFSPFEGRFDSDLSTLIPRDVDFYVAKAELQSDFKPFPELAVGERLAATQGGRTLLDSNDLLGPELRASIDEGLAALDEALGQSPIPIDPLKVFGGKDVSVAGYFQPAAIADAKWCAYGRTNWMGKLSVALAEHDWLRLADQGISTAANEGVISLSGGGLPSALHVARIYDVILVANDEALVQRAIELEQGLGEDSLGMSARYHDNIRTHKSRSGNELEVFVKLRNFIDKVRLSGGKTWSGGWPDPASEGIFMRLASKLFQARAINEAIAMIDFEQGVRIDLTAELSDDVLTAVQKRMYRLNAFDHRRILEYASYAPADTVFFVMLKANAGDLLNLLRDSLDDSTRDLIDDKARTVWGYPDAQRVIDDIEAALGNEFTLVVRKLDYVDNSVDAPLVTIDVPNFAWTVIAKLDNEKKIEELRDKIVNAQRHFSISGRNGGQGVFSNILQGTGLKVYEFHNPFIPATGHIATMTKGDLFFLGNSHLMLDHLATTFNQSNGLSEVAAFHTILGGQGLVNSNVLAWGNLRNASKLIRAIARETVLGNIFIPWDELRPIVERELLREHFAGVSSSSELSAEDKARFDDLYQVAADERGERFREEHLAGDYAVMERMIQYAELADAALLQLSLDTRHLDLFFRARVPFDDYSARPTN